MTQISLTAVAVAFLSTDVSAQRLLASWPLAVAAAAADPEADRTAIWAQVAGVALVVSEKVGLVLLRHGLVLEDGTVAEEAARVLNALAARKLKELAR